MYEVQKPSDYEYNMFENHLSENEPTGLDPSLVLSQPAEYHIPNLGC
jgi:hypothetical protein